MTYINNTSQKCTLFYILLPWKPSLTGFMLKNMVSMVMGCNATYMHPWHLSNLPSHLLDHHLPDCE